MRTLLKGATLIDGTGAAPVADAAVLVDGSQIHYAGPVTSLPDDWEAAKTIDLSGKTLLPGLINTHVHFSLNPYGPRRDWAAFKVDETTNTLEGYALARECLERGVTAVGDLSAPHHGFIKLSRLIEAGVLPGPRIVSVGRALVVTGGHSYTLGREIDGPAEAAKAAREEIKAGAKQVKLMVEAGTLEGALERQELEMSHAEIKAAVEAAHGLGCPVRAHAITSGPVRTAIECGVDVIEHGYDLDDETIELMVEREIPLVPTIQVWKMALLNEDKVSNPAMLNHRRNVRERVARCLPKVIQAGVKIALGTDGSTMLNPAGEVTVELASLVEYGMSPLNAISAATKNAAEVLGLSRVGVVAEGKDADLIAVDGNPLKDMSAIGRVHLVMRSGEVIVQGVA